MSKVIKLLPENIEECLEEFKKNLASSKWADGKISFSKTLGVISRKATVYFTEVAWMKMQALVREFEKEVAWHGVATRGEDETKDEYIISDILVYPQKVSGASVEMDTEEYAKWLEDNIEDERFFNIRMQGHSHVNMAVSPSSIDLTHQEAILDQLTDSMFYIFMIWNKRGEKNVKIYDIAKNVLFETSDISIEVLNDGYGIDSFVKESKAMVIEKGTTPNYYPYPYYKSLYTSPSTTTTSNPNKKEEEKKNPPSTSDKSSKKRKGKRKKKNKHNSFFNNACDDDGEDQMSLFEDKGYDPYDAFGYYGY